MSTEFVMIKVQYQKQEASFPLMQWEDLSDTIITHFGAKKACAPALLYRDSDGDTILLNTDEELRDALAANPSQTFRLVYRQASKTTAQLIASMFGRSKALTRDIVRNAIENG
jgi:hypothetical protein